MKRSMAEGLGIRRLAPLAALLAVAAAKAPAQKVAVEVVDAGAGSALPKLVKSIKDAGFEVAHEGKAEVTRSVSEVYFAKGHEETAKKIAAVLGAPESAVHALSWKSPYPVVVAAASPGEVAHPRFAEYPAEARCSGPPAPVDFSSDPDSKRFVTRITEGAATGPNFAGCYTVIEWGCGTECQAYVIVDARTGRIFSPERPLSWGAWYRRDSRLFVTDPVATVLKKDALPPPSYITTRFFEWTGSGLTELARTRALVEKASVEK